MLAAPVTELAKKAYDSMKSSMLDEEGAEEFVGVAPKSNVAKEITDILIQLNHWSACSCSKNSDKHGG